MSRSHWTLLLLSYALAACSGARAAPRATTAAAEPGSSVVKVFFVDSAGGNFLFRGSVPDQGDEFEFDSLKAAIIAAGADSGVVVPQNFYMIDVNLLQLENPGEPQDVLDEFQFFTANPDMGQLRYWRTQGTPVSAENPNQVFSGPFRDSLIADLPAWLGEPLLDRVDSIRAWLEDPSRGPTVVYVHCIGGCDRTGEMIGAYALRYKGLSWEVVNAQNFIPCNRPFGCDNYNATQWYCLWLNRNFGLDLNCDANLGCT
ncbi:MAG TPA: hypothetical protein VNP72_00965 [Longimicrobium sp.]|nr:hypothetical protein [Longimicrobium sp.]